MSSESRQCECLFLARLSLAEIRDYSQSKDVTKVQLSDWLKTIITVSADLKGNGPAISFFFKF